MRHWRRLRHVGGVEPAPLTPAQVAVLEERQDTISRRGVRIFLALSFQGIVAQVVMFELIDVDAHAAILAISVLILAMLVATVVALRAGQETAGVSAGMVIVCLHILLVCTQISAAYSLETYYFPLALIPFLLVRKDLPTLRNALSAFAIGAYVACEVFFPEGTGNHSIEGAAGEYFALTNRMVAGLAMIVMVILIQARMTATRRILEGAASYGELRATTDELTGVYNRRPVIAQLSEWAAHGRGNYAISLIDLDHFKNINDEFGHDCGDTILQAVAATLRGHFRDSDMVSRWGGDEFLVLIPGVRHADLVPILERLRRSIALIEEPCGGKTLTVTVSIGAAMGATGQTPDECVAAADHALYRAKEEGRNKVVAVGVSQPTQALGRPSTGDVESWTTSATFRP